MAEELAEYQRLQRILDVFGNKPGSILYRGPDMWLALEPGPIGWVLVIGDDGMPKWEDPANVNFGG